MNNQKGELARDRHEKACRWNGFCGEGRRLWFGSVEVKVPRVQDGCGLPRTCLVSPLELHTHGSTADCPASWHTRDLIEGPQVGAFWDITPSS